MRDRLIKLILNTPVLKFPSGSRAQGKTYQTAQNFADHLLANGVIVPPCKVGDKVYVADKGGIREATANEIYFYGSNDHMSILLSFNCDYECENCPFSSWSQEPCGEYSCGGEYGCWDVKCEDFGKTVFLTKEEAETALERSGK